MATKTLIPALRAHVGDWQYYVSVMTYATVSNQVNFAYELGNANQDLSSMIQRGLSSRTKDIEEYLRRSKHRFLGALIIACYGGDPQFKAVEMRDDEDLLADLDDAFGVLTFDGTQSFFALDGQHRLRAIKDAVKAEPSLGSEEICVLLVSHSDDEVGREKTRRLFTNINRNAKVTTGAENIALDEDNGYSILVRRFLAEDPFFSRQGVVRVFTKLDPSTGTVTLASKQVPVGDAKALTTIVVLHELLPDLAYDSSPAMHLEERPTAEVLDEAYNTLQARLKELFKVCGNIEGKLTPTANAKDLRAPKGQENKGQAMMRPVVQLAVAKAVRHLIDQDLASWDECMVGLSTLDWEIGQAPWTAVWNSSNKKMITAKENQELLFDLLLVHLAPESKAEIKRARKKYAELKNSQYPVTEETLAGLLGAP